MKRAKKILKLIVIFTLALLVIDKASQWLLLSDPNIIQTTESPDRKYVAYVYESNGGATSRFVYHLTVLPKWIPLGKGRGNTWIDDGSPCKVKWNGDCELFVDIYPSNPSKKETWVWGVDIVYAN